MPSPLASLSVQTATLVAQDSAANVLSNLWSFTVDAITIVPASWAYPAGSGDLETTNMIECKLRMLLVLLAGIAGSTVERAQTPAARMEDPRRPGQN